MNDKTEFWKNKLAAFLHDPPSKALDIATHGERSDSAFRQAGFADEEVGDYFKHADHVAAAADRLPFPKSQASGLKCRFDGVKNTFRHPMTGEPFPFRTPFASTELAMDGESAVQPALSAESLAALPAEADRWRARLFAHWRLWPRNAADKDYRLGLLPAETRLPDHTIWTHMQVTSALAGCQTGGVYRPALLKLQLGPVQDFIAQARSTRDLWSGSYLLSWLMAAGLKALSAEVGPDAVIFPNLRGQPLFDLMWRDDLWSKVHIGTHSVWEDLAGETSSKKDQEEHKRNLLIPNLPNVFLAVVPADRAAELAELVNQAIRAEWSKIAAAVWNHCDSALLPDNSNLTADEGAITREQRHQRFTAQADRFLSISWQTTPWPDNLDQVLALNQGFAPDNPADTNAPKMPVAEAHARVLAVQKMAEQDMPKDHRDGRFYVGGSDGPKEKLNNLGLGWSILVAYNSWQLDAIRQTRAFPAWAEGGWSVGAANNKDALNGRDETVAGGQEWLERCDKLGDPWAARFKHPDWLGAPTLIKRLWDLAYLKPHWRMDLLPMPHTRGIAAHDPYASNDAANNDDAETSVDELPDGEKYFAVLALDGDEIGKWVSGEKNPVFRSQLADYLDEGGDAAGALAYFTREADPDGRGSLKTRFAHFLNSKRPLSPGYHLQFSEALSNFALRCARPIVEAYDGRLIYAGGDDVLALLPADTALACAAALRAAFTGRPVELPAPHLPFQAGAPGFLASDRWRDQSRQPIPFLVPGPAADCSVGLAIAHFKSPLQDVVRAAQAAEKRAKTKLGRAAVAITLLKRSGETIEWGCRWNSHGVAAAGQMLQALKDGILSGKFPYRLVELVANYISHRLADLREMKPDANGAQPLSSKGSPSYPAFAASVRDILLRELDVVLERQRGAAYTPASADALRQIIRQYLQAVHQHLDAAQAAAQPPDVATLLVEDLVGLCQTVAFLHRNQSNEDSAERQTP